MIIRLLYKKLTLMDKDNDLITKKLFLYIYKQTLKNPFCFTSKWHFTAKTFHKIFFENLFCIKFKWHFISKLRHLFHSQQYWKSGLKFRLFRWEIKWTPYPYPHVFTKEDHLSELKVDLLTASSSLGGTKIFKKKALAFFLLCNKTHKL